MRAQGYLRRIRDIGVFGLRGNRRRKGRRRMKRRSRRSGGRVDEQSLERRR